MSHPSEASGALWRLARAGRATFSCEANFETSNAPGELMKRCISLAIIGMLAIPALVTAQAGSESFKQGMAALQANDGDAAVKAFEKAIAASDKTAEYHLGLARALGVVAQKANVLRQPLLARRCKAEFERTVQLDPSNISAREGMLQFYMIAPSVMGGSMEKAHEQAEAIFKINRLRGHIARGNLANREKDLVAVEREFRAAWTAFPDSAPAATSLAGFLANTHRADEALAVMDKFVSNQKDNLTGLFWFGRVATSAGKQLDRGEQALRRVLASSAIGVDGNPAPVAVNFRLGELLAKKGDKAGARQAYEAALRLNPNLEQVKKALKEL